MKTVCTIFDWPYISTPARICSSAPQPCQPCHPRGPWSPPWPLSPPWYPRHTVTCHPGHPCQSPGSPITLSTRHSSPPSSPSHPSPCHPPGTPVTLSPRHPWHPCHLCHLCQDPDSVSRILLERLGLIICQFVNFSICLRWEKSDEGGLSKAICASCTNLHNWSVLVHAFYSIQSNLLPNNKNTTPVQWYKTFTLEINSHLKTRWN